MTDLEILHFEQLKTEVQDQFLKENTASDDNISKWKGIDIVYFQEDLRKKAKGNISEKSFYTYFKTSPVSKLPRIDMLNLLSTYAGYQSWYDFKKNHLFADEILQKEQDENPEESSPEETNASAEIPEQPAATDTVSPEPETGTSDTAEEINSDNPSVAEVSAKKNIGYYVKKFIWYFLTALLASALLLTVFYDDIFAKSYTYCFTDSDRNTPVTNTLEIKVNKKDESPIIYKVRQGECFVYTTKDKNLYMTISSPFYKGDTVERNLQDAPRHENIELKPDDYAIMLYYYSKSIRDLKNKREQLDRLISDDALIYQVFDNQYYGVETLTKQKYITLVTLPSTSLEQLNVIDTKMKDGKIVMIKFRISDEKNK